MPLIPISDEKNQTKKMQIAVTIRDARARAGLSIITVAVQAGVAQGVVERLEAGENTTVASLLAVAQVLGVTVEVR